jgi:hypothetical protein
MYKISRAFTAVAVALVMAVGAGAPGAIFVEGAAAKSMKRHCVKYKTVKAKNGKKVRRCAKYSK